MPKYKVFLTMEFTAEVEAESEDEAREILKNRVVYGCGFESWGRTKDIKLKRYWGGGDEVKNDE